jgi:hypothetical protein
MAGMMIRFAWTALMMLALSTAGLAQDPTRTLPDNYRVALDNDYVRVVKVHYDAGAKLPDHTHPGGTTVYLYLNDSEGVTFRHSSGSGSAVTRPPVKAGGMRISNGPEEHHAVENASRAATDFLRIFVKTEGSGGRSTRRIPPSEAAFENAQVRITRMTLEQHDVETIDAPTPVLLVEWPSGSTRWLAAGTSTTVENHDAADLNVVRIAFLTKPK